MRRVRVESSNLRVCLFLGKRMSRGYGLPCGCGGQERNRYLSAGLLLHMEACYVVLDCFVEVCQGCFGQFTWLIYSYTVL